MDASSEMVWYLRYPSAALVFVCSSCAIRVLCADSRVADKGTTEGRKQVSSASSATQPTVSVQSATYVGIYIRLVDEG
jgi:hypothetical protein